MDAPREPDGYAYFYPSHYGGRTIRFNGGEEVNGGRPEASRPYWIGTDGGTSALETLRAIVHEINSRRSPGESELGLGGAYLAVVALLERIEVLERVRAAAERLDPADGSDELRAALEAAKEST